MSQRANERDKDERLKKGRHARLVTSALALFQNRIQLPSEALMKWTIISE